MKSLEKKLEKLSQIVEQVEDSQTPLDKAMSLYKDGIKIAKECGDILCRYEEDVLVLQNSATSVFQVNDAAKTQYETI